MGVCFILFLYVVLNTPSQKGGKKGFGYQYIRVCIHTYNFCIIIHSPKFYKN